MPGVGGSEGTAIPSATRRAMPDLDLSAKYLAQSRANELEAKGTLASEKVLWMRLPRVVPEIVGGTLNPPLC